MRLLLGGGGSGGSAAPLLAVAEHLRRDDPGVEILYVGTAAGPEAQLAQALGLPYCSIQAGKLRRYLSPANLTDPVRVLAGVAQSLRLVRGFRPYLALGAGGFASVPPLVACWLSGVPYLIHQQDVKPGLANRLLAPMAGAISVSLPDTATAFPAARTRVNGNPVRPSVLSGDRERGRAIFGLDRQLPVVLFMGGGTGALALNRLVAEAGPELVRFCQVIHVTGPGRQEAATAQPSGYRAYELLVEELADAYALADLVFCRAGFSTLTELAALGKPSILVPMPDSHQRANASYFARLGSAVVLEQSQLDPPRLASEVRAVLEASGRRQDMSKKALAAMPTDATQRVVQQLLELLPPSVLNDATTVAGRRRPSG